MTETDSNSAIRLPARGFTLWLAPEIRLDAPLKLPSMGTTLWIDPASWPRTPIRLPGNGTTLWLNPAVWPQPKLKLPANGTTLWLTPDKWPQAVLRLPANATTLWLDPSAWISKYPAPAPAAEVPLASNSLNSVPSAPVTALVSSSTIMNTPLRLPANGFTVWTRAATAAGAPAAPKALLRLPGQQFTIWTRPERAGRSTAAAAPAPKQAAPVTAAVPPSVAGGSSWLPVAAALALAGVLGFLYSDANTERHELRKERDELKAAQAAPAPAAPAVSQEFMIAFQRVKTEAENARKEVIAANAAMEKITRDAPQKAAEDAKAIAARDSKGLSDKIAALESAAAAGKLDAEERVKRATADSEVRIKELQSQVTAAQSSVTRAAAERDAAKEEVEALKKKPK